MSKELYTEIFHSIKKDIESNKYGPGEMIPSENTLSEAFGTSRMTVRKALLKLTNEGYIYPIAGKGNFVKEIALNRYMLHYNETESVNREIEDIILISVDIVKPNIELVYYLQIPQNKRVVVIKRVFVRDGEKIAYDEKYIPYYSGIPIVENEIHFSSFPEIVSDKISLFSMEKKISIHAANPGIIAADYLGLSSDDAVMIVEQTLLDELSEPVGWGRTYYRIDSFRLNAKLIKNNS
ncbi:MAG: GntR family transcriptional regulator [Anaerofustis sp.]